MNKILPVAQIRNRYQSVLSKNRKTIFCFAYQDDLDQAYAFYCSRYENISYEEFLNLGLFEFKKKLGSIPKDEPLYDIIKSRTIKLSKIKDKQERAYWKELKRVNEIPQIFLDNKEIDQVLNSMARENKKL